MLTREQAEATADTLLRDARGRQARAAAGRSGGSGHPAPWAGWALAGVLVGLAYDWLSPGSTHASLAGFAAGTLIGRWRAMRAVSS